MARLRTVIVAGAGIGGLTTALALARAGFRAHVFDQARVLEETGAGIQLSPNATRVLLALGLGDRLKPHVVAPEALRVMTARGREIVRVPLGESAATRYGAPYWVIHRGDLQAVLLAAARANYADIGLDLGSRVEDYAVHANGMTIMVRGPDGMMDTHGLALIGADGLWSSLRAKLGESRPPVFSQRTAWRAVVPVEAVPEEFRAPIVHLWLGPEGHVVHYPIKGGRAINIVAIIGDQWREQGWSAPGAPQELALRFMRWAPAAREMIALPQQWLKWALFDRMPLQRWGQGPVTLLGDAAHPMLPFLAQGAAMAIEDAAVLANSLATIAEPAAALRAYEKARQPRTTKVQAEARANGRAYHLSGLPALLRNMALAAGGGERLGRRYDWIYNWQLP